MCSIGQLAERAGVTVKTVRFYSDRGLLPEAARSGGGHRRYGPDALDRLRLIRSLRTLDLPVPDVRRVLDQDDDLEDLVARQLREVTSRLAALRWREAALRLLAESDCTVRERAERLRLIGTVSFPPGTAAIARFWRCWLPARLPARVAAAVVDRAVPALPDAPTPAQVLAFARLQEFVTGPCAVAGPRAGAGLGVPEVHVPGKGYRPAVLYEGLPEAFELAAAELRAGRAPHAGEALDCFAAVHAAALGRRDTADFRRGLHPLLAAETRVDRYWQLTAEIETPPPGPPEPTPGAADNWLRAALGTTA
ncbi:MerR family transcriptional regulator [Streptomyces sp. NPDC005865]|uniref:helix-turn-helix domain-containing protein n=1 Tax=Streptomyces sp. NPDC005865 TaxID=3155453 RepID=UPI0033E0234A